jgi:uncharacterized protein
MRIELENLGKHGGRFSQNYEIGALPLDDLDLRLTEPAEVHGRVIRSGTEVELQGELKTRVAVPCSRCLNPVEVPIQATFAERFVPAVSWRDETQHELQSADLNLAAFDGEAIDLDELVREEIVLAVPDHVLCREECKGLCPVCGIDRNVDSCQCEVKEIDSRWEKLRELQK